MKNKNYPEQENTVENQELFNEQPTEFEENIKTGDFTQAEQEGVAYFDADVCKSLVCPTCNIYKEAEDVRLRSLAEMENFKKRLQKEKDEQMQYATESVLADLLPTLDNLDLAIQYGSTSEACKDTLMGVEMTRKCLLDSLKRHGLELVGIVGEKFNPERHEAIGQEEHEEIPSGHACAVMQKGYLLKGRLLRPAKIVVSRKAGTGSSIDVKI